jgi:quercetin dioxygenase-like cupin family protein
MRAEVRRHRQSEALAGHTGAVERLPAGHPPVEQSRAPESQLRRAQCFRDARPGSKFRSEWSAQRGLIPKPPDLSSRLVIAGNPAASGMYAIFAKYGAGGRSVPHTHPDQRLVTVISGTYCAGAGTEYDESKMKPLGPGTTLIVPANSPHYAWAKDGEVIVQEVGNGPTGTNIWPKAAVK